MNHSKIAAALHALADAFLADVDAVEAAVTGGKKGGKKTAAAAPTDSATVNTVTTAVNTAGTTVSTAVDLTPAPVAPSVTLKEVNAAVLKVAAKSRDVAVAILGKLGLANTVGLPPEKWQAVFDAFEEEIAKQDAAAVQVQQASLV